MRAVRFSRFGGPEVLEIADLPDPLAEVAEAHRVSERGHARGKLVLLVG